MQKKLNTIMLIGLATLTQTMLAQTWGDITQRILEGPTTGLARVMSAICLISGIAFLMGAVIQFKQYRDNPTQVRISTPIALVILGAVLLLIPLLPKIASAGRFLL